jgi:hypothetical protein
MHIIIQNISLNCKDNIQRMFFYKLEKSSEHLKNIIQVILGCPINFIFIP